MPSFLQTCRDPLVLAKRLSFLQGTVHVPGSRKSRMTSRELLLSKRPTWGLDFIVVIVPGL